MTRRIQRLLLPLVFFPVPARAQVVETWSTAALFSSYAHRIALDPLGRVVDAGDFYAPGGTRDVRVEARDPSGAVAWTATFDSTYDDTVTAFAVDAAGNTWVCGTSTDGLVIDQGFVARIDPFGAIAWSRVPPNRARGSEIAFASNGDAVIAGQVPVGTSTDLAVLRYDASGTLVWSTAVDGTAHQGELPHALALDASDAIVVCGETNFAVGSDSLVARLDSAGVVQWVRTLAGPGSGYEQATDVAVDAGGNAYVVGFERLPANGARAYLWKLDAAGNTTWIDRYGSPSSWTIAVEIDPRGNACSLTRGNACSLTRGDGVGEQYIVRLHDELGNLVWETSRPRAAALALALDGAGEALVFGSDSDGVAQWPFVTRYDRDGHERWTRKRMPVNGVGSAVVDARVGSDDELSLLVYGPYPPEIVRWQPTVTQFCSGDGSGAACPCGNASPVGERAGCASSFGDGARLVDLGVASLSNDTLRLAASRTSNSFVTFFQGTTAIASGSGAPFGDGLRCAGGAIVRIGTRLATSRAYTFPSAGDAPVSVAGQVTAPGVRTYQVLFRNVAAFCTSATFNLSNALRVDWSI